MRVLYDISTLGLAQLYEQSRGGSFRVDLHITEGLAASDECELLFCANHSTVAYHGCQAFLARHPELARVPLLTPRTSRAHWREYAIEALALGTFMLSACAFGTLLWHPSSSVHHALGEPNPDYHLVPPPEGDDDCYSLGLYCSDADDVVARAEAAGATVREPLMTFVSGDRFASIRDPFGIRWSIMTRVEDLSEDESARRVAEWAKQQEG